MQYLDISSIINKIENKRILVGVSGGADSMVLLSLLLDLQKSINFYMEVIHVNHNLRAKESDDDQKLVEMYSQKNNLKCIVKSVNVLKNKNDNKQTLEQSARELRYNVINEYKQENKFDYVVIAHNSDDNAETVLMHICRGSGLRGASGIQERNCILRPLLCYSKEQILQYAIVNKIPFRDDSSNKDIKYTRNFIRHEILPKLAEIYPNIKENLIRFAEIASIDNSFIDSVIDYSLIKKEKDCVKLSVDVFSQFETVYSRLIYRVINMLGIYSDIEYKHIGLIKELSTLKNGNYITLPHNLYVYKEYNYLVFSLIKSKVKTIDYKQYSMGEIEFLNYKIEIDEVTSDDVNFGDGALYFDLDSIPSTAIFRTKKDGDIIQRLGTGTKKFSDYLTDKKVPLRLRDSLVVLANNNKILLTIGMDISDDIKITSTTNRIGKLIYKKD